MAVVRCPVHKIPYNDENPRGCPACHREAQGADRDEIMRQLAYATGRHSPTLERRPPTPKPPRRDARATDLLAPGWRRYLAGIMSAALAAVVAVVVLRSRPRFVEAPDPPVPVAGTARDLPFAPGTPVAVVFAILGSQAPRPHPDASQLARYAYGADLSVDTFNDSVYALTVSVGNRRWRGLQVGMAERHAQGSLALVGTPLEVGTPAFRAPMVVSGYAVYRSLDARPERTLRADVRPPNGCFDVLATLQPRALGILVDDQRRYAVVGREGAELEWVVSRVRVVSRAVPGPYANGVAC